MAGWTVRSFDAGRPRGHGRQKTNAIQGLPFVLPGPPRAPRPPHEAAG